MSGGGIIAGAGGITAGGGVIASGRGGISAGSGGVSGGSGHPATWRVVPLGDSITGSTCYPQLLSQLLIKAGRTNFSFVGSQLNNQDCNGAPNVQSEGHGGYWVTQLLPGQPHANEAVTWAADNRAEIV